MEHYTRIKMQIDALKLPQPQMGEFEDNIRQLVWDRGEHHLEIDLTPEGYEWFYRNRTTEQIEGDSLGPFEFLSDELKVYMLLFVVLDPTSKP